jgi:hypothetical protein
VNIGRNIKENPKTVLREMEEKWNERQRQSQEQTEGERI